MEARGNGDSVYGKERKLQAARLGFVIWLALLGLLSPCLVPAQNADLQVTIGPAEAVQAGAKWRVDDGAWMNSGTTATGLVTHRATITFADIPGWNTPDPVQMWVFSGLERATKATYVPVVSYSIGEIPSLQAYEGQTLQFQVFSRALGASATLSAVADPTAPTGPMTTDLGTSKGLFAYTPDPADKTPFDVIFTASVPGQPDDTQRVTITPMPKLPSEQLVFGLGTGLAFQGETGDDKPEVVVETVANQQVFNLSPRDPLRKVTITGNEVVFDPAETEGLFARLNYQASPEKNADIVEMVINAVRVVIRGPLRLPKTNVTINALELRFEDKGGTASLCTTPLNYPYPALAAVAGAWNDQAGVYTTPPVPAQPGARGERAGNVRLNIASLFVQNQGQQRLNLRGARGQDGGEGLKGPDGSRFLKEECWINVYDYVVKFPEMITYYHYTYWAPPTPFPVYWEGKGTTDRWPGYPGSAIPGAEPGDGGAAGDLYSTLLECLTGGLADQRGGEKGDLKTLSIQQGSPGWPFVAWRVWVHVVWEHVTQVYKSETRDLSKQDPKPTSWEAKNEPWYDAVMNSKLGDVGTFILLNENPLAFMHPDWLRRGLNRAKAEYLYGDIGEAEELLSEYTELVDIIDERWGPEAAYDESQIEMLTLRDEMRSLLYRIQNNLDYFGNPAGWVPMLSFEVNQTAFRGEIEHALNLMYLAYWVRNTGFTLEQRISGLEKLWNDLGEEASNLQAEYERLQQYIPQLRDRVAQIQAKSDNVRSKLLTLEADLRRQAENNLLDDAIRMGVIAGAQLGLRIGGLVLQAVPVGQPALGAVGGIAQVAGKFDYNAIFEPNFDYSNITQSALSSVSGFANVAATFTDQLYTTKKAGLDAAMNIARTPASATDITRTEAMRKVAAATKSMAQSVNGITQILGDFKMPMPDIEAEVAKLVANSTEYTKISKELLALAEEKMELMNELAEVTDTLMTLPNLIMRNMLAMNAVQRELDRNKVVFSPKTVEFINEVEGRARERLLKYHYYMARAYEYRLLKPYEGRLDLGPITDKIIAMADQIKSFSLDASHFDSLKEPYLEQIASIAGEIFDLYNSNRPELSAPIGFNLTGEEVARLNAGQPVVLNLMEIGLFPPSEENVRIVDFLVDDLQVHLEGDRPTRWASLDLYMEHSGLSQIVSKGEVYRFRHYNPLTENPIVWGARYDHFDLQNPITPIRPSAASDSLLRSLLTGAAAADMMLYSRPAAWADIVITKTVNTENNVDIVLDSVRLKLVYDFVRRPAGQSALRVLVSESGFTPFFQLSKTDLNNRQDGRGSFYRSYPNKGTVNVQAQPSYGDWKFQKWTDAYGRDLEGAPTKAGFSIYKGWTTISAWTDPVITVDLSTHRAIRAQYVYLPRPRNLSPAIGEKNVPVTTKLDWTDIEDATSYDLYLWRTGDSRPTRPTATGLTVSEYTLPAPLDTFINFSWQVVAYAEQVSQEGTVWSFRTGPAEIPTPLPTPPPGYPQPALVYEFDKPTLEANGWTEIPGGFGVAPNGSISLVDYSPNLIPSTQDGKGMTITVQPDQVAFVYADSPILTNGKPALMRMTVRSDAADASIFLAGLKGALAAAKDVDGSVALNNPVSTVSMRDEERRLVLLYELEDGTETITPIIQVAGAKDAGSVTTVLIDRLEVFLIDSNIEYPGELFTSAVRGVGASTPVSMPAPVAVCEFSQESLAIIPWSVLPGGFGGAAAGSVYPMDFTSLADLIPSSLDRQGMAVTVEPNQVALLFSDVPVPAQGGPVLLRMTARSDTPNASLWLVGLKGDLGKEEGFDGSVAYINTSTTASLVGNEGDFVLLYEPDTGTLVTPCIQIAGRGDTGNATVLIDRLEVFQLDPNHSYPGTLLTRR